MTYDSRGNRIKQCAYCKQWKRLSKDFFKNKRLPDGRCSQCKTCYYAIRDGELQGPRKPKVVNDFHKFPVADRMCPTCHYSYASFPEFWRGDICVFCEEDRRSHGGSIDRFDHPGAAGSMVHAQAR